VGPSLRSCVEVHEPVELSFGEVSGVSSGIGVLDGVHVLQGEGAVSVFALIDPLVSMAYFVIEMYSTRADEVTRVNIKTQRSTRARFAIS